MKRATEKSRKIGNKVGISIHALVKRATDYHCGCAVFIFYFNPRPREEGDGTCGAVKRGFLYFNPRPREEGDHKAAVKFKPF